MSETEKAFQVEMEDLIKKYPNVRLNVVPTYNIQIQEVKAEDKAPEVVEATPVPEGAAPEVVANIE